MQEPTYPDDQNVRRMLWSVDVEVKASLAIGRATLAALATLAPRLRLVADQALEDEIARAARYEPAATRRVLEVIGDMRDQLQRGLADAAMARTLERALVDAADALPETYDLFDEGPRRCANG